jgi:hypothetical protein
MMKRKTEGYRDEEEEEEGFALVNPIRKKIPKSENTLLVEWLGLATLITPSSSISNSY